MTQIQFLITEAQVNNMTWEEYEAFEFAQEGETKLNKLRPVIARFMVDENNKSVPFDKAMKLLGKIPIPKIKETIQLFTDTLRNRTIPKANGTPSDLPSDPAMVASESQAG